MNLPAVTTQPLRILIIDDEEHARSLLREMLEGLDHATIVGEATDGVEALSILARDSVDLVLLDVQMPEMNGFELIEAVGPQRMPTTVFITAYDQYAVRAFEVNAIDYVLKPYDRARILAAVARAMVRCRDRDGEAVAARMLSMLDQVRARRRYADRIAVRSDNGVRLLELGEVSWIEADDKTLRIHAGREILTTRGSLRALEEQLDPNHFVRVHRASIVNAAHVRELQQWFQGDYLILLRDGTKVTSGRAYRDRVVGILRAAASAD